MNNPVKNMGLDKKKVSLWGAFFFRTVDRLLLCALLASVAVFILFPIFCIVKNSLFFDGALSFHLYDHILRINQRLLRNSVFVAVLTSILSTILAAAVAVSISSCRGLRKNLLKGMLMVTMVSPPFISSLAYIQLFGRRGFITWHMLGLSLNPYGWHGIVLMQSLSFTPLLALFLLGMLEKVSPSLPNASRDLGASPSYTLLHIILPLIRPALWACLLLSFIRSLADFGTPIVIGGRFDVLASEIYLQIIGYADLSKACALNMLILIPVALVFLIYRRLMRRADLMLSPGGPESTYSGAGALSSIGGFSGLLIRFFAAVFFGMMTLQYLTIFFGGFLKSIRGRYQFTLEHLTRLLAYDTDTLTRSVFYALIVAVAGTIFAMLLSYYIERRRIALGGAVDFIATLPYMVPGISFGIGYILAFNHTPLKLTGTAAIVVLNMLFKQLPNSTKICSASLAQIPFSVEEAARDAGAGPFHVIKDIILPNMDRAFTTGFVYNFTSSMTTAGAILFLINPGKKVAVFRIFDAINTGEYGVASLLSSFIILITLAVNLALPRLAGAFRKGDKTNVRLSGKFE